MHLISKSNQKESKNTKKFLESNGCKSLIIKTSQGEKITVINVNDNIVKTNPEVLFSYSQLNTKIPYVLASKIIKDTQTVINFNHDKKIGDNNFCIIAGPCSIESEKQIMNIADSIKSSGAHVLRGGAFKPRSSPYAFQGMGEDGLKLLYLAGKKYQLPIVTEVLDPEDIPVVSEYSDIIQVGARNCQNFSLLKKLGKVKNPVLLKRGMMTTIREFLLASEYILSGGNMNVILCERGIRTFETETRNTLDISAVPLLKEKTHLPVIVDPSHATGISRIVEPMALASIAAGADGIMIEVHDNPEAALCDGEQSIKPDAFDKLMIKLKSLANVLEIKI